MKNKISILITILLATHLIAQNTTTPEKKLGVWYMYNGNHKLSHKFSLKTMAHFRFFEIGDDLQQFIVRLGGNYKFNKNLNATLGYSYLNTDSSFLANGGEVNEHRIYEDLNLKHKIADLGLTHRLRAEQRFFNSITDHFIRYQFTLSHPLFNKWSTYLYNEIFFDFDGEAFNQNWLGLGLKYSVSNHLKLQLGYMKIFNDIDMSFDRIQLGISINTKHF
ncbi:uncharacterized protein DUF2490 [Tenacibaculum adriaticum]|uniref:Uncharacterized protein DUF2490 n=1 Tax=Tenacibaculum adriaticum TaxID=413713 RepID=A0A5S5DNL3_9FLAO|nr:DUF2490 domain-containing protein [Tenacibaculum adriaticum]TYP97540.1 uncharacterized protein DUF2490 [Tenacibaculum adriaticum]